MDGASGGRPQAPLTVRCPCPRHAPPPAAPRAPGPGRPTAASACRSCRRGAGGGAGGLGRIRAPPEPAPAAQQRPCCLARRHEKCRQRHASGGRTAAALTCSWRPGTSACRRAPAGVRGSRGERQLAAARSGVTTRQHTARAGHTRGVTMKARPAQGRQRQRTSPGLTGARPGSPGWPSCGEGWVGGGGDGRDAMSKAWQQVCFSKTAQMYRDAACKL